MITEQLNHALPTDFEDTAAGHFSVTVIIISTSYFVLEKGGLFHMLLSLSWNINAG